ncbi:MAG: TolC family protein [Janthinobacterium lividum]
MQLRSKLLMAAATAAFLPLPSVRAQAIPSTGANANPVPSTAGTLPAASNALPAAPSTLLAGQDTGPVRPAGSGIRFVAPSTIPGPGGSTVEKPTDGPLLLSLDDAISFGLQRNVRLKFQQANQRLVLGYTGQITNALIPNLNFKAASSTQEINLIGLGFKPSLVAPILAQEGLSLASFPTLIKVSTTTVQISLDQVLFNLPDFELYRAIKPEIRSVNRNIHDNNEQLVQAVTMAYLQVLADQANLQNSIAQEAAAKLLFDQAAARDQAGVGVRLDVLRAQVEYQQRQQQHVSADAQLDKDGIQLNRIMGIPAGQELDLTDVTPFSELADMDAEQAKQTAYTHRNDLLSLDDEIEVAGHELHAVKYQRLPTVGVNGFYGILGLDSGPYHGVFTAEGTLRFPVFREAAQRGEEQTAAAQLTTLRQQEANLRGTIDAQIRTNLLDITSSDQLVKVAQSNAELAQQELSDARDRFAAGVSDNLEVVDALATVTGAQAQLVSALYQYNVAKVGLARSTGLLESRYRAFLGM